MSRSFVKLCQWKLYFSDTRWRSAPRCPQCFEAPSLLPEADLVSHRDDSFLLRAAGAAQSALTAGCSAEEERSLSLHCSCSVCLALGWLRESDGVFFFLRKGECRGQEAVSLFSLLNLKINRGRSCFVPADCCELPPSLLLVKPLYVSLWRERHDWFRSKTLQFYTFMTKYYFSDCVTRITQPSSYQIDCVVEFGLDLTRP